MHRLLIVLSAILLTTSCAGPASGVRFVGAVRPGDPPQGVNARQDARHEHDRLAFAPAHGRPLPLPRAGGAPGLAREVFGFAPYWTLGSEGSWRLDLLSTVAYFGVDVQADGRVDTSPGNPGWRAWNSQDLVDLVDAAHRAGVRVVVVMKQFDEQTIDRIVTDPTSTQAAIDSALQLIGSKNLDGVNVDFEGQSDPRYPGIQDGLTRFVSRLYQAVHRWRQDATVTVDTYSGSASWDGGLFKIAALAPAVDAFFVMAYDMGSSDLCCQASPNAPLRPYPPYDDTDAVAQYLSKAPPSKIILGVPYYGYKWSTKDGSANSRIAGGATADDYAQATADIECVRDNHLRVSGPNWDATAGSHWIAWYSPPQKDPCGGDHGGWRELYYEDPQSLALKYDLVNARNLRGAGIWALGFDGTSRDLWAVLAAKFRSS